MKIPNNFCVLPFLHLSTRTDGTMQLCCHTCSSGNTEGVIKDFNLKYNSHIDKWNSEFYKNIRKKFLNNEIPESCKVCFKEESEGYRSKRLWENELWLSKVSFDKILENKVRYIDLKFGNNCNFACLMCNASDSSRVQKKFKNIQNLNLSQNIKNFTNFGLNKKYDWFKNNNRFWDNINLKDLEALYIIGGEPTINPEFKNILKKCVKTDNAKHIDLRFNTNGSFIDNELSEIYKKFKKTEINISLDGIKEFHEYIRTPGKWADILKNLKVYEGINKDNIEVNIDCTVSILNIEHIPDFIKWKVKNLSLNKISFKGLIGLHPLYSPDFLSTKCLSKEDKERITQKFEDLKLWLKNNVSEKASKYSKLDAVINHMNSEDWYFKIKDTNEYLNKIRK